MWSGTRTTRRVVEVDELEPRVVERLAQARRCDDGFGVAPVTRPFGHDDRLRAEAPERVRCSDDDTRIGVDRRAAEELDEVRLEHDGAAADVGAHDRQARRAGVQRGRRRTSSRAARRPRAARLRVNALRSNAGGASKAPFRSARGRLRRRPGRVAPERTTIPGAEAHRLACSGSRSASGPVARAAHASDQRLAREMAAAARSRRGRRARERRSSSTPWKRNATERLRRREPAGLGAPLRRRNSSAGRTNGSRSPCRAMSAKRPRLHVAGQVHVVDRRVAVVPATVDALPLARGAGAPLRAWRRRSGVNALRAISTRDVGSTNDRASLVHPQPPALLVDCVRRRQPSPWIAASIARRAAARSSSTRQRAPRSSGPRAPPGSWKAPSTRCLRRPARFLRIANREGRENGRLHLGGALARRESTVGPAKCPSSRFGRRSRCASTRPRTRSSDDIHAQRPADLQFRPRSSPD